MRSVLVFFFTLLVYYSIAQVYVPSMQFSIIGKYNGTDNGIIFLRYTDCNNQFHKDSAKIIKSVFQLKGCVSEPTVAVIEQGVSSTNKETNTVSFFLEAKRIEIICKSQ